MVLIKTVRAILYFCSSVYFFSLAWLYYYGNVRFSPNSKIIFYLQKMLLFLGVFFGLLVAVAITDITSQYYHEILSSILVFFLIPIIYYTDRFREYSVEPKEDKTK